MWNLMFLSSFITAQDYTPRVLKRMICVLEDESTLSVLPYYHYLENNVGGTDSKFPFALDGNISPHFYLFNEEGDSKFTQRILIDINPQVNIRIIKDQKSAPIRTASFKPSARLHFLKTIPVTDHIKIRNFHLGYLHHSNGQDGKSIADEAINDIPVELQYINDSHHFNVYNGDFALNFLTIGFDIYSYRKRPSPQPNRSWLNLVKDDTGNSKFALNSTLHLIRLNYNLEIGYPETPLDGYYSYHRPSLTYKRIRNVKKYPINADDHKERELDRLSFKVSCGLGKMDLIDNFNFWTRVNAELSYHVKLPQSSNVAIMIHLGYQGSDDYNIYLEDKNIFFKLGISTSKFLYDLNLNGF